MKGAINQRSLWLAPKKETNIKLNLKLKDQIMKDLLELKFSKKEKEIENRAIPLLIERHKKESNHLDFTGYEDFVKFSGCVILIKDRTSARDSNIHAELPVRLALRNYNHFIEFIAESEEEKTLIKEWELLNHERWEFRDTVGAVMNSCTTTKQLCETLPAIKEIVMRYDVKETPIIAVSTIKKAKLMLGGF